MKEPTADEIKLLIENFEASQWKELSLQVENFRIFLSRDPDNAVPAWLKHTHTMAPAVAAPAPQRTGAGAPGAEPAAARQSTQGQASGDPIAPEADIPAGAVAIKAPNLGIFYRAPKPGASPYVNTGDQVGSDTEVCLIEVMKLFTPVTAGIGGKVVKICVEDGEMVEHDQALFYIQPEG